MANMPANIHLRRIRCALPILLIVSAAVAWAAIPQRSEDAVYVVSHVDLLRQFTDKGIALLKSYEAESRKDPGMVRLDVLEESARPNHFTILEIWRTQADYDAHVSMQHTKRFRDALYPMLGSPYDERLNHRAW